MGLFNDLQVFIRVLFFAESSDNKDCIKPQKRGCRNIIGNKALGVLTFFQDVVFFTLFGAGIAIINYYYNNGRFRIYAPVAAFLGFIVYYFSLGHVSRKLRRSIAYIIRRAFFMFFSLLFKPVLYFFTLIGESVKKSCININKALAKRQKLLYNKSKERQILKRATEGFVEPFESCIRGNENDRKKIL